MHSVPLKLKCLTMNQKSIGSDYPADLWLLPLTLTAWLAAVSLGWHWELVAITDGAYGLGYSLIDSVWFALCFTGAAGMLLGFLTILPVAFSTSVAPLFRRIGIYLFAVASTLLLLCFAFGWLRQHNGNTLESVLTSLQNLEADRSARSYQWRGVIVFFISLIAGGGLTVFFFNPILANFRLFRLKNPSPSEKQVGLNRWVDRDYRLSRWSWLWRLVVIGMVGLYAQANPHLWESPTTIIPGIGLVLMVYIPLAAAGMMPNRWTASLVAIVLSIALWLVLGYGMQTYKVILPKFNSMFFFNGCALICFVFHCALWFSNRLPRHLAYYKEVNADAENNLGRGERKSEMASLVEVSPVESQRPRRGAGVWAIATLITFLFLASIAHYLPFYYDVPAAGAIGFGSHDLPKFMASMRRADIDLSPFVQGGGSQPRIRFDGNGALNHLLLDEKPDHSPSVAAVYQQARQTWAADIEVTSSIETIEELTQLGYGSRLRIDGRKIDSRRLANLPPLTGRQSVVIDNATIDQDWGSYFSAAQTVAFNRCELKSNVIAAKLPSAMWYTFEDCQIEEELVQQLSRQGSYVSIGFSDLDFLPRSETVMTAALLSNPPFSFFVVEPTSASALERGTQSRGVDDALQTKIRDQLKSRDWDRSFQIKDLVLTFSDERAAEVANGKSWPISYDGGYYQTDDQGRLLDLDLRVAGYWLRRESILAEANFSHLRSLKIDDNSNVSDVGIVSSQFRSVDQVRGAFPELRALVVARGSAGAEEEWISMQSLVRRWLHCEKLERVCLCREVDPETFALLGRAKNLRQLGLGDVELTPEMAAKLVSLTQVKELNLSLEFDRVSFSPKENDELIQQAKTLFRNAGATFRLRLIMDSQRLDYFEDTIPPDMTMDVLEIDLADQSPESGD